MKLKPVLLAVLSGALFASPVNAGVVWTFQWAFDGCGGTDFETCISGSVYTSGNTVRVDITNDGPGVMTAVGLWNLPEGTLPTSGTTDAAGNWGAPANDISGVVSPAQRRYAVGTTDGINSGIADGGSANFYFNFSASPLTFVSTIGVGAHMQGLEDCSSKVYLLGPDGSAANPFSGSDEDCGLSVPEPGSLFLLGSGAAGMAFVAGRRRKNQIVDEDGNDVEV